jgi:hypothetical protein
VPGQTRAASKVHCCPQSSHCWACWPPQARVPRQILQPVPHGSQDRQTPEQPSLCCDQQNLLPSTAIKQAWQHFAVSSCRLGAAPQRRQGFDMGVLPICNAKPKRPPHEAGLSRWSSGAATRSGGSDLWLASGVFTFFAVFLASFWRCCGHVRAGSARLEPGWWLPGPGRIGPIMWFFQNLV